MGSKYRHVVRHVFNTPWAIQPETLEIIADLVEQRRSGVRLTQEEIASRIGGRGRHRASLEDSSGSVALLRMHGVLAPRINAMTQISGGTSAEQFTNAFNAAVSNPDVAAIVIDTDSPGGSVYGTPEAAEAVFAARGKKPIVAVASPMMASAAYWIASAADEVIASPSSEIGSIGAMYVHTDATSADEKMGVKRTIIRSAQFKNSANSYEPLSDSAKAELQERVDHYGTMFVEAVARHRGVSVSEVLQGFGQGRMFNAQEALHRGMVDRIATLEQVLTEYGVSAPAPLDTPAFKGVVGMDTQVLTALVRRGLCAVDASEGEANAVLRGYFAAKGEQVPDAKELILQGLTADKTDKPPVTPPVATPAAPSAEEDSRVQEILAAVNIAGLENGIEVARKLIDEKVSVVDALKRIQTLQSENTTQPGATRISVTSDHVDRLRAAASDAIMYRTYGASLPEGVRSEVKNKQADVNHLQSLNRLAEECLVAQGNDRDKVRRLNNRSIAMLAMGLADPWQHGLVASGPSYNVTGMFSNLMLDAANKTLRSSYSETDTTFDKWMKRGANFSDFKAVNRILGGELPDPKAIPENGAFEESTVSDARESYSLTVWGQLFSISWQAVVNDDLSSFTEIPMKMGRAMRRKQNKLAYTVLTDNAALSDTGTLFNSTAITTAGGHANLAGSAGAPSTTTLNAAYLSFARKTGLNVTANTVLNLQPKWIIIPPDHRQTVYGLLYSPGNPSVGGNVTGHEGVVNLWQNALIPIVEPQLTDANAWYLATDWRDCDTIEYAYLDGLESPAVESATDFERLGQRFRIYQAFGVKAIDYRGLYKNAGT